MKTNWNKLVRENVQRLTPYSCARDEFKGKDARAWLDANENPFSTEVNRYPDPYQAELKEAIANLKQQPADRLFLGNGSDEVIDLLFRAFCEPGRDNVILLPPTYGMYQVSADINNVETRKVPLTDAYGLDVKGILGEVDAQTKLIFVCSPNNPTGNSMEQEKLEQLLNGFDGVVVVDEAYIDFSAQASSLSLLSRYDNLVVTQTFSKAWGMAGVRLGMGWAVPEVIEVLNRIKPPYNVNTLTQQTVLEQVRRPERYEQELKAILDQRDLLLSGLQELQLVKRTVPSDANFILFEVDNPDGLYTYLMEDGLIVRNRSRVEKCAGCLRVTVGTEEENKAVLNALRTYEQ